MTTTFSNAFNVSIINTSNIPAYVSDLSAYEVRALTGSYAPTGEETMQDATPSEWLTSDPGTLDLRGVIDAWGGGIGDPDGARVFVKGGGHNDSANNGLYIYDFNGTTKPTGWTVKFQSAVSDVISTSKFYADGLPSALHAYDNLGYVDGEVFVFGGYVYGNPSTTTPYSYNIAAETVGSVSNLPQGATSRGFTVYDPATNKLFFGSVGSLFSCAFFDVASRTYGSDSVSSPPTSVDAVAALDTSRSRLVMLGSGRNLLWTLDFSTDSLVSESTFSPSGSTSILSNSGLSAFYDADRDSFWIFGGKDGSPGYSNLYEMDASSFAITAHSLTGDSFASLPSDHQGSYKRFVFFPEWRAIGFVIRHNVAPYIIRLPS